MVDDAIRFVSQKFKENLKCSASNEDGKESNEHDYSENEARLEEEQDK